MNDRRRNAPARLRVLVVATAVVVVVLVAATSPAEGAPQPVRDAWIDVDGQL